MLLKIQAGTEFLVDFAFAVRMAAGTLDVRYFFHRFTLHAAVFAGLSCTRTGRMSTFFCVVSFHLFSLRPGFAPWTPKCVAAYASASDLKSQPSNSKHTLGPGLFKMGHFEVSHFTILVCRRLLMPPAASCLVIKFPHSRTGSKQNSEP